MLAPRPGRRYDRANRSWRTGETHGRQPRRTPCWSPRPGGRRRDARSLRRGTGDAGLARGAGAGAEIRRGARLSRWRQQCRGKRAGLWQRGDAGGDHRRRRRGRRTQVAMPEFPAPDGTADRRRRPPDDRQDTLPQRLAPASVHRCGGRPAGRPGGARPPHRGGAGGDLRLRRAGDLRLWARCARRNLDRGADRSGTRGRQDRGGRSAPGRCVGLCRRERGDPQYRGDGRLLRHSRRQRRDGGGCLPQGA